MDPQTAREWSEATKIPYTTIVNAVRRGELEGRRFSPRGQIYITPEAMEKFFEDARLRARQ